MSSAFRASRVLAAAVAALTFGIGVSMADHLYVLNKSEASVSILDVDSGDELARVDVGVGPHEAAASPDGSVVVVCNYGIQTPGGTLSVIDTKTHKVIRTIDLDGHHRPHGILFLPNGDDVVVTAEHERRLIVVDVRKGKVKASIDTGQEISHMVALTPDAKRAFVANIRSGSVSVIDLESEKLVKILETGDVAEGVVAHPTRSEIWVTNRSDDTVSIVDSESLEIVDTLECASFPIRAQITPDGRHALISCAKSGDVAVFETRSRRAIARISMTVDAVDEDEKSRRLFADRFGESPVPIGILICPDGCVAYVANTNADVITVLDLENWRVSGRLVAGKEPDGLAWVEN